jgi:N,N'-diacetyllegionaminate synthase
MNKNFLIDNKEVGMNQPIFFIAEAGVNHNGSTEYGFKLIDIAVSAGADAVKFQTFKAENLNTVDAPKSQYHIDTTGNDDQQSWFDLLKSQEISLNMHKDLIKYCKKKGIIFLSTPYDEESADLLESLNVGAFKIASTDTNNLPFLRYVARKKKPMIISSAMCSNEEVVEAVETIRSEGLEDIIVCQCTGNYPSKIEDSNLKVIKTYESQLNCLTGYSDHTLDFINPILAVGMGISLYEKHFTIDKELEGPDHRMSLSPDELRKTISILRKAEISMGNENKVVLDDELENRQKLRKSVVAAKDISKNDIISLEMLAIKRPGFGIQPKEITSLVGSRAMSDIKADSIINYDSLEFNS